MYVDVTSFNVLYAPENTVVKCLSASQMQEDCWKQKDTMAE